MDAERNTYRMSFAFTMAAVLGVLTVGGALGAERTPFMLVWFAALAYGWVWVLAAVPYKLTISSDGSVTTRSVARTRSLHLNDLLRVKLVQRGEGRPRRAVLRFRDSGDLVLYSGDVAGIAAQLRTLRPDVPISRSWTQD